MKKPFYKRGWVYVAIIVLVIFSVKSFGSDHDAPKPTEPPLTRVVITPKPKIPEDALTKPPQETAALALIEDTPEPLQTLAPVEEPEAVPAEAPPQDRSMPTPAPTPAPTPVPTPAPTPAPTPTPTPAPIQTLTPVATTAPVQTREAPPVSAGCYRTPTGECYHFSASCAGKNAIPTTVDDALARGLRPCKKCAGG